MHWCFFCFSYVFIGFPHTSLLSPLFFLGWRARPAPHVKWWSCWLRHRLVVRRWRQNWRLQKRLPVTRRPSHGKGHRKNEYGTCRKNKQGFQETHLNITSKKWWLEDYFPLKIGVSFQGRTVKLRGCFGGFMQMLFMGRKMDRRKWIESKLTGFFLHLLKRKNDASKTTDI